MTLVARDEADIVDAQIAFHLNAGVDFVVAIDNGSQDGTTKILESYMHLGHVHLIRDDGEMHQGEWVTRMARMAATDFGADWVINSDVDGFWWPRGGSLKEVLAAVPARFGCVRAMVRNFVPRPGDDFFAERMTVRVCDPGAHSNSPYSPRFQTAHRADPGVTVNPGNHHAFGRSLRPLPRWYPIDMLHFPIRSTRQCERKYFYWWSNVTRSGGTPGPLWTAAVEARRDGRMDEFFESFVVDDEELRRGVADGTLAIDTRLRDALRELRVADGNVLHPFRLPEDRSAFNLADSAFDEAYLSELAALENASDPLLRSERRVAQLEARLARLETGVPSRVRNALKRLTPPG